LRKTSEASNRFGQPSFRDYFVTVNFVVLVPVPPAVVTTMGPVTAPVGTIASTWVSLITSRLVEATAPNVTLVAP
jgi:hypothetical protein